MVMTKVEDFLKTSFGTEELLKRIDMCMTILRDVNYAIENDTRTETVANAFNTLMMANRSDALLAIENKNLVSGKFKNVIPTITAERAIAEEISKVMRFLMVDEIADVSCFSDALSAELQKLGIHIRTIDHEKDEFTVERAYEIAQFNFARAQTARVLVRAITNLMSHKHSIHEKFRTAALNDVFDYFYCRERRFALHALMFGTLLGKKEAVVNAAKNTCYTENPNSFRRWEIMHFLSIDGNVPSFFLDEADQQFRKDIAKYVEGQ